MVERDNGNEPMNKFNDDPFADLPHYLPAATAEKIGADGKPTRPTFPCVECAGSGKWRGGRNQNGESKCFACGGRGYFFKSYADRMKNRDARKASKIKTAQAAFDEANHGLMIGLRSAAEWNQFAASLVDQFNRRGDLSEKQVAAARKMLAKVAETRAARAAALESKSVTVDLSAIRTMFATATGNGLKRPTYRAESLVVSRAPDTGRNAGSLYVKSDNGGEYLGKIDANNVFRPTREANDSVAEALLRIASAPAEAAVRYGRLTGRCSCCGRELTDPVSVENGIGPICASKFGF